MVKLLESRQKVMMLEKMILGEKWNGVGQFGLETRLYVYAKRSAEKVSESEMMNSHIPNFFEFVLYGEPPPAHKDSGAALTWDDIHYPQT
jgi:hypothetical protein